MASQHRDKPMGGTVVAVGPGTSLYKMVAKVGDTVKFPIGTGKKTTENGEDLLVMNESDCMYFIPNK